MGAIEFRVDPLLGHPSGQADDRRPAEQGLHCAHVPAQQVDLEPRTSLGEPEHEVAELHRIVAAEPDPRVEIPADQHDAALGRQHGAARRLEIVGGIDDHRGPGGALDAPAIHARFQRWKLFRLTHRRDPSRLDRGLASRLGRLPTATQEET
jgi:hypothetical protein